MSTAVGEWAAGAERQLPDPATLATRLARALGEPGLRVLERQENPRFSTAPSEIVSCELSDGRPVQLFCKYGKGSGSASYGHRGGVEHEARVYRGVLRPLGVDAPRLYGSWCDDDGNWMLAIEHLRDAARVSHYGQVAIESAASWIGRFHERSERWLSDGPEHPLARYDADYYSGWAERTLDFHSGRGERLPWLPQLARAYRELASTLQEAEPVVVHGEYYPGNILMRSGRVHAIDWESAAIAAGEVDLAAITEGWEPPDAAAAIDAYVRARWAGKPGRGFEERLGAARLYLCFRWLGERRDWTVHTGCARRFDMLQRTGEELGLI